MPDNTKTRIRGTVDWFNGVIGRVNAPDGKVYAVHIANFEPECRGTAKELLRKGSVIEFSIARNTVTSTDGRAENIALVDCGPLPEPTGLPIGYWQDFRGVRCSSCGERHKDARAFCPDCGAAMYEKEIYGLLAPRLAGRKSREETCVDRSDYTDEQWSAICGLFGTDPGLASGLSISRAVVLTR